MKLCDVYLDLLSTKYHGESGKCSNQYWDFTNQSFQAIQPILSNHCVHFSVTLCIAAITVLNIEMCYIGPREKALFHWDIYPWPLLLRWILFFPARYENQYTDPVPDEYIFVPHRFSLFFNKRRIFLRAPFFFPRQYFKV